MRPAAIYKSSLKKLTGTGQSAASAARSSLRSATLEVQALVASLFLPGAAVIITLQGASRLNTDGGEWLFRFGLLCWAASVFNFVLSLFRRRKSDYVGMRLWAVLATAFLAAACFALVSGAYLRQGFQERKDARDLAALPLEVLNLSFYGSIPDGDLKSIIGKGKWVDTTTPFFEHVRISAANSQVSVEAKDISASTCRRAAKLLDELPDVHGVVSRCNGTQPSIGYVFSGKLSEGDVGTSRRDGEYSL